MYRDVAAKIEHYRDMIYQEFAKKGLTPGSSEVATRLSRINHYLSIFRHENVSTGETFDAAAFTQMTEDVYADLKILYQLVYDLTVTEMAALTDYADAHVADLAVMADRYEKKNRLETQVTSLGKTVMFKSYGFTPVYQNGKAVLSLGSLTANAGSQLSGVFEGEEIEDSQVTFTFTRGSEESTVGPWSHAGGSVTVPGSKTIRTYAYAIDADQILNEKFAVLATGLTPKGSNEYKVLAGENKLSNKGQLVAATSAVGGLSFSATDKASYEGYIYGASYITFHFSKAPSGKNFSGSSILSPQSIHRIAIDFNEAAGLTISTNGRLFAACQPGTVAEGRLWYPKGSMAKDFLVHEASPGELVTYSDVSVSISDPPEYPVISLIAVKQLG